MRIDPTDTIAGTPIVHVRDALRRFSGGWFSDDEFLDAVEKGAPVASRDDLWDALRHRDLLRPNTDLPWDETHRFWAATPAGARLAAATAAKPLKRATAQRNLDAFLDRVAAINADDQYAHVISRVTLFGSMLDPDADPVSDVDLGVETAPRFADPERHRRAEAARRRNRTFSNHLAELLWPETEILKVAKGGSRAIQLVDIAAMDVFGAPRRVVYARDAGT